ncbi:MAG: alkaline phosphatase family protein [Kofleriaceae bacterium]
MPTIALTSSTITPSGDGFTGSFVFTLALDGSPPTALTVAVTQPQPTRAAATHAAWQQVAGAASAWNRSAATDGQGGSPMDQIEHVVVLMLENRGFDHVLGWLYDGDAPAVNVPPLRPDEPPFVGLAGQDLDALANRATGMIDGPGAFPPRKGARSPITPAHNPHESYKNILTDLFGVRYEQLFDRSPAKITQRGYVLDYGTHFKPGNDEEVSEIMDTYVPEQLPVLNGLARHYGVSDAWFCSVPSQTNTNRAFLLAGTARGMVKNGFYPYGLAGSILAADQLPADTRTIFDVLEENGHGTDWMLFWQAAWPPTSSTNQYVRIMFPKLGATAYDSRFAKTDEFFRRAADGTLPAISFIEPEWGGGEEIESRLYKGEPQHNGNDYHPVSDTTKGEDFVHQIYTALATSKKWNQTLLLITFDENGGTYDHVPPPAATPSARDRAPVGYKNNDLDPTTGTQFGFTFDLFGVRVPTLAISPWVAKSTVFRSPTAVPFDHTSVIATILTWKKIGRDKWNLGERTAAAPTFDQVLTLAQPRPATDPAVGVIYGAPPVRSPAAVALTYGAPFKLKFIGNKWPYGDDDELDLGIPQPAGRYLGPASQSSPLSQYYPTLGPADQAIKLTFTAAGKQAGDPVGSHDVVQLKTTEGKVGSYHTLGAWRTHFLYYYTVGHAGQDWEVRLPSYRLVGAPLYLGDQIILLSRAYEYQRMTADTTQPDFLTTTLGDWAYWQLVAE